MTSASRPLLSKPSLRHLKLEARRRLSAGEFSALWEAQLAIAREHGQPSWAALKKLVEGRSRQESRVLPHLRWVISRFRGVGSAGWTEPDVRELRRHFHDTFLKRVPPGELIKTISDVATNLREGYVVTAETPLTAQVQIGRGMQISAAVEPDPPHRVTRAGRFPLGTRIADERVASPASRLAGEVPEAAAGIAAEIFTELGLPGLVLAGGGPGAPAWTVARGWADLDRAECLRTSHRFPAGLITRVITATAVLRLVAGGRVGLDDAANDHLRTFRLADGTVTVRELLTCTGGVDDPAGPVFADTVPDLAMLTGPVLPCGGPRGMFRASAGGYAALGQLIADVIQAPYADAVARLVFEPLGMSGSSFPVRWPDDPDAVTGHRVNDDMMFAAAPAIVCAIPAAGGMWSTAADLVRFGVMWSSLLPEALAREAVRPQAAWPAGGGHIGLGWHIGPAGNVMGMGSAGPGTFASLLLRDRPGPRRGNLAHVALTNRRLPIHPVNLRVLRACRP